MRIRLFGLVLSGLVALAGCGGGGGGDSDVPAPPPTGTLDLTVLDDATGVGISGARVVVLNGDTGETINVLMTDENGKAGGVYYTGALQLKVSGQGYDPSPAPGLPPLPVQIVKDQTTPITVNLFAIGDEVPRGMIGGTVTGIQAQPLAGALVVATVVADGSKVSTTAGPDGTYVLYNVAAGDVIVDTFFGGYNFVSDPASVIVNETATVDIAADSVASGQISGHIQFVSISGSIIDVTLLHPGTREILPGLRTYTDSNANYTMTGVPDGTFEIVASLNNDGYVLDPDISVTQGIPEVTISGNAIDMDFKVTGSIALTNPALNYDGSPPELPAVPTFTWLKASSYASLDDYAIEVVNESGDTVWGGFDPNTYAPYVTAPKGNEPSIVYAGATLEPGRYYQFRVYARVLDGTAKGYTLLSASETLDGIFKVAQPAPAP